MIAVVPPGPAPTPVKRPLFLRSVAFFESSAVPEEEGTTLVEVAVVPVALVPLSLVHGATSDSVVAAATAGVAAIEMLALF
jgi:hypothetical protein